MRTHSQFGQSPLLSATVTVFHRTAKSRHDPIRCRLLSSCDYTTSRPLWASQASPGKRSQLYQIINSCYSRCVQSSSEYCMILHGNFPLGYLLMMSLSRPPTRSQRASPPSPTPPRNVSNTT